MVEATKNQSSEQNTPATTEVAATEALASMTIKPEAEAEAATATATVNPEEEKKESFIYHGMGNVQNKNTVQNLESRKATW